MSGCTTTRITEMCLVVLGWQQHSDFPLIVAGNRDEFHQRPTETAHWWPDQPDIVGGRDLQAGGTWMAIHRRGRFATVTNYRDAEAATAKFRSRGHLVTEFLLSGASPEDYLASIHGADYAGFNLLVSDGRTLAWLSNHGNEIRTLPPGVYGLANALLDTPWHKVVRARDGLHRIIESNKVNDSELLRLLDDRQKAPVADIDNGRLPFATAHAISAPFIVLPDYGTRSSSAVTCDANAHWQLRERQFDAGGKISGEKTLRFSAAP